MKLALRLINFFLLHVSAEHKIIKLLISHENQNSQNQLNFKVQIIKDNHLSRW